MEEKHQVPFEALQHLIGTINYGGRITDSMDARVLQSLISKYFDHSVLHEGVLFQQLGYTSKPPENATLHWYQKELSHLPADESPSLLGLHPNSNSLLAVEYLCCDYQKND